MLERVVQGLDQKYLVSYGEYIKSLNGLGPEIYRKNWAQLGLNF